MKKPELTSLRETETKAHGKGRYAHGKAHTATRPMLMLLAHVLTSEALIMIAMSPHF